MELTFGADTFGAEARGSEYDAIATIAATFSRTKNARLFVYQEPSRTFHPKVYLFANEKAGKALAIIGSSNWSAGGFHHNVEVNVVLRLDLSNEAHRLSYQSLRHHFMTYWQEVSGT